MSTHSSFSMLSWLFLWLIGIGAVWCVVRVRRCVVEHSSRSVANNGIEQRLRGNMVQRQAPKRARFSKTPPSRSFNNVGAALAKQLHAGRVGCVCQ